MKKDALAVKCLLVGACGLVFLLQPDEWLRASTGKWDSFATEAQYLAALHSANESTFRQEFESEFLLLLSERQRRHYESLSGLAQKKNFIENYWRAVNPNPLLPENDILLEHLRRRAYARKNFPSPDPPYFDDRGKYYIKYGDPIIRFKDNGGLKQLTLVEFRDDANDDYTVRINESWSYENVARDFVVHFAQVGQRFREIESLTEIIITPRRRSKQATLWSDIVKKRASVSPALGRLAAKIEHLESSMRLSTSYLVKNEVVMPTERIFEVEKKHKRELKKAISLAPPSAHQPIHAINALTLDYQVQQFRDKGGLTRVEITLLSPIDKNLLTSENTVAGRQDIAVEFSGLLRDAYFRPAARQQTNRNFPVARARDAQLRNVVGTLTFFAPAQPFELTVQVKDRLSNKIGFDRKLLQVADFRREGLLVSDVQFLTEVTDPEEARLLPVTQRQNLTVAPYPFVKIRKSRPLLCYFEVYNLRSAGVDDEFEVTYRLYSERRSENVFQSFANWVTNSQKNSISFSYTQPVQGETAKQLIGIDFSKVPNGDDYVFEIVVTDPNNPQNSTRTARRLAIAD